ncbi:MAG: ribonuclease HI [Candidatus Bathyarchaeia archaeon]
MIVAYFDGSCEPVNPGGIATYGFVIYFDDVKIGEGRGLATEPWSENATNNIAEYRALIEALKWLIKHGLKGEVTVRGDSKLCIMQMRGKYAVKAARIIPLYNEAKALSKFFKKVKFEWVPREQNKEADLQSEQALQDCLATSHYPSKTCN